VVSGKDSETEMQRIITETGMKVTRYVKSTNKRGLTVFYLYLVPDSDANAYKELLSGRKYNLNAIVCSQVSACFV
jgi:hypothetical protein